MVVAMFTLGMSFMGTFYSGIKANSLDIAPNYAGVIMAVANGLGGLTGVVGPYIVGLLTENVSIIQKIIASSYYSYALTEYTFIRTK